MWKCCVSIARFTRTKQTGGIKRAMRNSPLIILRLLFFFFRPSLPRIAPSCATFFPRGKKEISFFEENEPDLERREGKKKRLDRLLWQEGPRNWRGRENKRKSIATDHRVAFESRLWHTVSRCTGTWMESWSVRRSKYLPSLSSSSTGGERINERRISNNVSRFTPSFAVISIYRYNTEGEISIFFFFPPPSNFEIPRFSSMFSIKERFFYFLFFTPLVLDRILFRHQRSFEAPFERATSCRYKFCILWIREIGSWRNFLAPKNEEKEEAKCVRKIVFNASLLHSSRSFLPRVYSIYTMKSRWNGIYYLPISLEKYRGWKESHRKGKYWETNRSGWKMDIYFLST